MARKCEICGKGPQFSKQVSHAHNRSQKIRYPNLRRVKALINKQVKYVKICSRCLRSGKIQKV